jgi:hypothetical protein
MSVGSLGLIGSLAATPLPQKAAETDKSQRETADQVREAQAAQAAEAASGIGETEEDSQAAERDADGRRLWESAGKRRPVEESAAEPDNASQLAKDPTGEAGGCVDLIV